MSARRAWLAAGIAATGVAAAAVLARQRARHNRDLTRQAAMLVGSAERLSWCENRISALSRALADAYSAAGVLPPEDLTSRLRIVSG